MSNRGPRVPTFPPEAALLAQSLQEIIDKNDDRLPLAYGILTRLCVLWTPPLQSPDPPKVVVEYCVKSGGLTLARENGEVINDIVRMMSDLFPEEVVDPVNDQVIDEP